MLAEASAELDYQETEADSGLHVVMVSESALSHACGVTTSVLQVARFMMDEGHKVTIVCPSPAEDSVGEAEVITTRSVNLKGFSVGLMSKRKFTGLFEELEPDVVHAASPMKTPKGVGLFLGGHAISAASELGIPITAVYQTDAVRFAGHLGLGLTAPVVEKLVRNMHNKADLNLVPSSAAEEDLINWSVRPDSIVRWGRGVDVETFNPRRRESEEVEALRAQLAPSSETIIGITSRLEPEKSIHKLEILRGIPESRMVVVGKGTQRDKLAKRLGHQTTFTGRLGGEDLANAYAAMDVFAYPSITDTFAQVVQEAKASGVPVVAAARGGPKDLVAHGETGYLYKPGGKRGMDHELHDYVKALVEDPELRAYMSMAARESVEDRTWQHLGREILGHYRTSIEIQRGREAGAERVGQLVAV
ncbi:MAG: glycosyltransferase [Candidatus Saccharimonadales bacterium]